MKTTAAKRTDLWDTDCPVTDSGVTAQLRACKATASDMSRAIFDFLDGHDAETQATWLARSVDAARPLFQPWAMELLFVLAVRHEARFGELQQLLGISSRTLSDKLQMLRDEGLVKRTVFDEQPVRISYGLTTPGRAAAALATPLYAHLNVEAAKRQTTDNKTTPTDN